MQWCKTAVGPGFLDQLHDEKSWHYAGCGWSRIRTGAPRDTGCSGAECRHSHGRFWCFFFAQYMSEVVINRCQLYGLYIICICQYIAIYESYMSYISTATSTADGLNSLWSQWSQWSQAWQWRIAGRVRCCTWPAPCVSQWSSMVVDRGGFFLMFVELWKPKNPAEAEVYLQRFCA